MEHVGDVNDDTRLDNVAVSHTNVLVVLDIVADIESVWYSGRVSGTNYFEFKSLLLPLLQLRQ